MHVRAERAAVTDAERDEAVATIAFSLATSGSFDAVLNVEGSGSPPAGTKPDVDTLVSLLEGAGFDDRPCGANRQALVGCNPARCADALRR